MKVERTNINNEEFLVTDYMYENDNVGISLKKLNSAKTGKMQSISCIPVTTKYGESFNNEKGTISISSSLKNEANKIVAEFIINYPDKADIEIIELDDNEFAKDIIETCIVDRKDIKEINCYKNAFDNIIEQIKNTSLENNIFIRTPEFDYKCYIYDYENDEFLGVANRMIVTKRSDQIILGEYIGKNLKKHTHELYDNDENDSIVVHLCINENTIIEFEYTYVISQSEGAISYVLLDFDEATIRKTARVYKKEECQYKIPNNLELPERNAEFGPAVYLNKLTESNDKNILKQFLKLNKPITYNTVNINKYLIM